MCIVILVFSANGTKVTLYTERASSSAPSVLDPTHSQKPRPCGRVSFPPLGVPVIPHDRFPLLPSGAAESRFPSTIVGAVGLAFGTWQVPDRGSSVVRSGSGHGRGAMSGRIGASR